MSETEQGEGNRRWKGGRGQNWGRAGAWPEHSLCPLQRGGRGVMLVGVGGLLRSEQRPAGYMQMGLYAAADTIFPEAATHLLLGERKERCIKYILP